MWAKSIQKAIRQIRDLAAITRRIVKWLLPAFDGDTEMILETQGVDFVLRAEIVCAGNTRKSRTSAKHPLNIVTLKEALSEFEYHGQPIDVLLHPPCICLKTFELPAVNPEKWLAARLNEIAPPSSRRDLVMCHQFVRAQLLMAAFVRRSFLDELSDLLRRCRVSVAGINAGGALGVDAFMKLADGRTRDCIDFSLCSYELEQKGNSIEVLPRFGIHSEVASRPGIEVQTGERRQSPSALQTRSGRHRIDFRPQAGFPRLVSSNVTHRIVRAEVVFIAIIACSVLLLRGAQLITGRQSPNAEYHLLADDLSRTRHGNDRLVAEFTQSYQSNRPRFSASTFLKAVALATPPQLWLVSVNYNRPSDGAAITFSLNGYASSSDEPLRFMDSLRNTHRFYTIALTKASTVATRSESAGANMEKDRLIKFEIVGKYGQ